MKKTLSFILVVLSLTTFGQNVTFSFEDLYAKKYPSTADYKISDNSIDFLNKPRPDGYVVRFTGVYSKNLAIRNINATKERPFVIIFEGTVNNSNTNGTLKMENCRGWELDGKGIGSINSVGSSASQLLHITGKFNRDFYIHDINLNGGFNPAAGRTVGAAMIQLSSSYTADCNATNWSAGTVRIERVKGINAYDEFIYMGHYTRAPQNGYVPTGGDSLFVINCTFTNSGRDGVQPTGWRYVYIGGNTFANGAQEKSSDHCSGFSLNEGNGTVIVENNVVTNFPQFAYSGPSVQTSFTNNTYIKGGIATNQAAYLKSGNYVFKGNKIEAPTVKEAVITADGAVINWDVSNVFIGPKYFRYFNGGKSVESAVITEGSIPTIEERMSTGVKMYVVVDGQKIQIK